jgi:hypothetical protein
MKESWRAVSTARRNARAVVNAQKTVLAGASHELRHRSRGCVWRWNCCPAPTARAEGAVVQDTEELDARLASCCWQAASIPLDQLGSTEEVDLLPLLAEEADVLPPMLRQHGGHSRRTACFGV